MQEATALAVQPTGQSLVSRMASRFGVEPNKMLNTLKATAFKGDVSNEQMMALLIVAEQHGLNPWTKEIYAFPDKNNGIVPVVGVDGWTRILNGHPEFNGMEFVDGPLGKDNLPEWIECVIYRRDREHPTRTREYMAECKRGTGPWGSHPRRMLRHKSLIQCARLAMSFAGLYDEDEAQRIIEGSATVSIAAVDDLNADISGKATESGGGEQEATATKAKAKKQTAPDVIDAEPADTSPTFTYAQVAAALENASDGDAFNLALDMIRRVDDETQRMELTALGKKRREAIEATARG